VEGIQVAGLHVHCLAEGAQVGGWMEVLLVFLGLVDHCNRTGQTFDVGRTSDFDIALKSPELLRKAESLGVGLRSGGARTGPLSMRDLKALGLNDLASQLIK
jgi:filamentous hemagglutinin